MTGGGLPETAKDCASTRGRLCSGRSWMGYALAAAATALAVLLRWVLVRAFGDLPAFITFFPAVALVAMLLGARAGALATILSALAADFFFLPPHGFPAIASLNHAVSLGLFTAAGLLVSLMADMLDRARRRQAATERELLLRAMSEGMPDPLFLKDRDSRIIMANSATVRAIGKPAEQIVGHTDEEFFDDPAVARAMMANDRRVMESGRPETMEECLPGVEGGRTFLVVKTPWRDAGGRIIGVVVCARDVTERKRAEESLRESEGRFRAIFDHAALGIVEVNAQGRFISANSRALHILGYRPEELLGKTTRELTYPEDWPVSDDLNARLFDGRLDHFDCEKRYLKRDGAPLWVHLTVSACRDSAGRFVRAIGTVEDITERKRGEEALRESESRFQVLAAGTFEGIVVSEGGRIADVNEQMARMLGYEPAEMIGMGMEAILPPEARERVLLNIRAGVESHGEHDMVRKDGSLVAVETHGKNITYRNRSVRITAVHDISERKRAEEVLRRYELLASRSRDIILFIDRVSGRILEANAAAEVAYGYSREELLGLTLQDLRADRDMPAQLTEKADVQGALFETQHRRRDGSTFPVEVSSRGATLAGRRTLISVIRDITERKRAEEALRQSEARFRAFFEQAAVGTASADPATGRFLQVNSRYCEITGYGRSELLGMTFMDVTHPEDRMTDREKYDRLARGEAREYLAEKRYVRKDGRVIWVQVAVGMVRDAQGRAVQSVGVIQDITERRRWEEALRESEAGLAAAQRLAHIGSWEWDVANDTARWSDETFRIFGVARAQLQHHRMGFVEMLHPEDRDRVDQALSDALSGSREYDLDYRIRWPDGTERVIHSQAEVLRGSGAEPVIMRGTVHDITERKRWEDQLKELNATLEQRVAERTAVAEHRALQLRALAARLTQAEQKERQRLATILHDHLQQLLASTKFHLASFRRRVTDAQQSESLRQVDHLLDESLATSRGLMLDLSPPILQQGDMRQVLEWLAGWFGSKHGLVVDVQADEAADPQDREMRVLLFEAVRELLFNVVKHGKVDRAWVELGLTSAGRIQVIVGDEGVGFDPSRPARGEQDTSGFGLLSIRERLDWLGGQMEVRSAAGEGTRVTLVLPRMIETQAPAPSAALATPSPARTLVPTLPSRAERGKVRVLLADDHQVVRNGLAGILQMEPWIEVVGQASDGREAVELALQMQPDVVIMDVSMPNMDGVEATRRILSQRLGVKVIGLSMFDETGVVEAMRSAGAASYLSKSAAPDALVAAIRDCVNRAAAEATAGAGL